MAVYTIWDQATPTLSGQGGNGSSTVLGTIFTLSESASLTGIWFYSDTGSGDLPAQCGIFDMTTSAFVADTENSSPTWSGAAGSGWVKCTYDGSVNLDGSHYYIVAVCGPSAASPPNWLCYTGSYSFPVTSGIITAPVNNGSMYNGPYYSGAGSFAYPTSTSSGLNWWVDVEVTVSSGTPHSSSSTLTITPTFTAEAVAGHYRSSSLTVTPSFTARGVVSHFRSSALTVTPSFTADGNAGHYRTASLTVDPSFTASSQQAHTMTAALEVVPAFVAETVHAATMTATLEVVPVFLARGGHPATSEGTNLNQDQALYAPAAIPPIGRVFLR